MIKNNIHSYTGEFVFCERINATGSSPWHIRKLTSNGTKFGGGADTKALCGKDVSWDLKVNISNINLAVSCPQCHILFDELYGRQL